MYEHHLNAERVRQLQEDARAQAAAERDLRARHYEPEDVNASPARPSDRRRLLSALIIHLRAARARLAPQ